jgi:excisionase family DNA binding protein
MGCKVRRSALDYMLVHYKIGLGVGVSGWCIKSLSRIQKGVLTESQANLSERTVPSRPNSPAREPAQPTCYTVTDLAELPRLNKMTVRACIWQDKLPHVKLGRAFRVDRADLQRWIDQQKVGGA